MASDIYTTEDLLRAAQAENTKLRDRVQFLEARCGHLMNDRDRREQAALDRAEDCSEHGAMLKHWQRLAEWHWAASGQQENARQSIVTELILLERDHLGDHETVPVDALRKWLGNAIGAQKKVRRQPDEWPPLEEHLHKDCPCASAAGPARRKPRAALRPADGQDALFGEVA